MFKRKKKDSPTKEQEAKKALEKVEEAQSPQVEQESIKKEQNQVDQQQSNREPEVNTSIKKPDSERNSARDKSKSRVLGGILQEIDQELLEENNDENYGFDVNKNEENMEEVPPVQEDYVPDDKDGMIGYLMNRLERAEMAINQLYVEIEIEKEKRDNMRNEILEKKEGIEREQDDDHTAFRQRVEAKMTTAIERAIEDRINAENEKEELVNELALLDEEFEKIDLEIRDVHKEKCDKEFQADEAQYRINEQEMIIDDYNAHIERLTEVNNKKQQEIDDYTDEINDMKGVVETLIVVRGKLNHYIPDNFPSYSNSKKKLWLEEDIDIFNTENRSVLRNHIPNTQENVFDGTQKTTRRENEEEDFWYKGAEVYKKNNAENLKPSNYSTYPWQPKVQKTNSLAEMDRSEVYKLSYGEVKNPSQSKLPNINRSDKQEHLFKNKEYIDEFGPLKTKIVRGKVTVPRVKTKHGY